MKYKSKVVEIEAIQFTDPGLYPKLSKFLGEKIGPLQSRLDGLEWSFTIDSLEGTMRAELGDWVIKGLIGEFYPCKDEVFKRKYEPIMTESSKYQPTTDKANEVE